MSRGRLNPSLQDEGSSTTSENPSLRTEMGYRLRLR